MLFIAILIMGFLEVVGVASILPFMKLIAEPEAITQNEWLSWAYQFFGFSSHRSMLISTGVLVILLITASNLFSILTMWLQYSYSWEVAHNMSIRLLSTYLKKPYSFFLNTNTSELRTYLISEVGTLTGGVLIPIIELTSKITVSLVIFVLLMVVNPQIAIIMLLTLGGAYAIIYLSRQRLLKRLGEERIDANMSRYLSLEELLNGIKTIRVYGAERFFYNRFHRASLDFSNIQPRVQLIMASPRYILEILAFGGILTVTLYLFISSGDMQKALPVLSLYAVAGYRLLPALQKAFSAGAKLRHNFPVFDKLYDDLLGGLDVDEPGTRTVIAMPFEKDFVMKNITFQYENMPQPVLQDFNITIKKGEVIAFIGSTGSGKTTLIDLIVGLLSPTKGSICIDGEAINSDNVANWQKQIAYVPQEVFLFDDSVARNIVIGSEDEDIDYERLKEVAQIADIYDFITEELPSSFAAEIGERGVRLSGGQRQRLGLARALYQKPSILILDEATSALDSITEKGIIESLKNLPDDLTVIIIAHRLSTVKYTNCIYLLQDGNIIEQGDYDTLIDSSDVFRTMVQLS